MADDRWLSWQAEYAGTARLPGIWSTLLLFATITVVLLALLGGPQATAESGGPAVHREAPATTVPACARHFPPTCKGR